MNSKRKRKDLHLAWSATSDLSTYSTIPIHSIHQNTLSIKQRQNKNEKENILVHHDRKISTILQPIESNQTYQIY